MSEDENKTGDKHVENGTAAVAATAAGATDTAAQNQNGGEKLNIQSGPADLKQIILDGLEKKGNRGIWLW